MNFYQILNWLLKHLMIYFSSIASKLQGKIFRGIFIKPTDRIEVINTINNLSTNKAMGPNSIPMGIFHLIKLSIAQPLVNIINLSFEKGSYIEKLEISKVIPIFKDKGTNCNNYRPISLLPNLNKIIEELMHERVFAFLTKHKHIYDLQFGFRTGHSTNY